MNVKFGEIPKFPMTTAKQDGFTCSVTDLRYLNEAAVSVFLVLVEEAMRNPDAESVTFDIPEEVTEAALRVYSDILMGIRYEVKKRNWGKVDGCVLVSGVTTRNDTMTVHLLKEHVKAIREFMRGEEDIETFNLTGFVRFLAGCERDELAKRIKEETDE